MVAYNSTLESRNVVLDNRRTSLRLEPVFWEALGEIAEREGLTVNELCTRIDSTREERSLTAGIRVYVLGYFHNATTVDGHIQAGHGLLAQEWRTGPKV